MRNVGHKRLPEFIEEDYISAIETAISRSVYPPYFVEISRISQDEENDLGYDGVITTLVPFYVQFKRSTFHTPQFHGKTAKDRESCGYANRNGFFSFTLHKDRNSKKYDQHNALISLSQHAKAAYAAPLFYKRSQLSRLKEWAGTYPWHYKDITIIDSGKLTVPVSFRKVRVLMDSITFPPHAPIFDHLSSHEYTFSRNGDLCYHSEPQPVDAPRITLQEFVEDTVMNAFNQEQPDFDDGRWLFKFMPEFFHADWRSRSFKGTIKSYLVELDLLSATWNGNIFNFVIEDMDTRGRFLLAEALMQSEFGISQYILKMGKA
jgi:hypothetical protein